MLKYYVLKTDHTFKFKLHTTFGLNKLSCNDKLPLFSTNSDESNNKIMFEFVRISVLLFFYEMTE